MYEAAEELRIAFSVFGSAQRDIVGINRDSEHEHLTRGASTIITQL